MEKKKFLDKGGVEVIANKIKLIAATVDKLIDADQIKIITESELRDTPIDELKPNVQYNVIDTSIDFGEIWLYNNTTGEKKFVQKSLLKNLNPDEYTPIGIAVIPASHNVYGNGDVGVMALRSASADTPDSGADSEQTIMWGESGTLNLPELTDYLRVPSLEWNTNILPEPSGQQSDTGYLCVDFGIAVANPHDSKRKWCEKNGAHIGSPFNEDGSRNTRAYFTGATSDINGANNTNAFKEQGEGYDAINAVVAYGDGWYLPAVGELGYVAANRDALNAKLSSAGGQCKIIENQKHWTSSKLNASKPRYVDMSNGQINHAAGTSAHLVRPFKRVAGQGEIGQFWDGTTFKNSYDETCIGIVVIPTSHNVYGTGECVIMALQYATPNGPGSAIGIKMFSSGGSIPAAITTPQSCVGVDGPPKIYQDRFEYSSYNACIPSDAIGAHDTVGSQLSGDGKSKYYYRIGPFAPSPYTVDGLKNPLFFMECLSDINGKTNTDAMLSHVTVEGWQTANTITNSSARGHFPAACCCWRYSTMGTEHGDWYLPAVGELAYACVRQHEINEILAEINTWKAGSALLLTRNWYWSSTEISSWNARSISFWAGSVADTTGRNTLYRVRPFTRVSA